MSAETPDQTILNVVALLGMVAPERADDLSDLLKTYAPAFHATTHDQPVFLLETNPQWRLVRYSNRTLLSIWVLAWVMWQDMYCWSTFICELHTEVTTRGIVPRLPEDIRPFLLACFEGEPGQAASYATADALYANGMTFLRSDPLDWALWPSPIPRPSEITLRTNEDHFVKDLVHHTVGFFLLHEIRHLMLPQDGRRFDDPLDEERECDRWAREFVLVRSDEYARTSRENPIFVKSKRAMGLFLGTAVIAHVQERNLWESGRKHPSVAERVARLAADVDLGPNDYCWTVASSFLPATLRRQRAVPGRVEAASQRGLFEKLLTSRGL